MVMVDIVTKVAAATLPVVSRLFRGSVGEDQFEELVEASERQFVLRVPEGAKVSLSVSDVTVDGLESPARRLLDGQFISVRGVYREPSAYVERVSDASGLSSLTLGEPPEEEASVTVTETELVTPSDDVPPRLTESEFMARQVGALNISDRLKKAIEKYEDAKIVSIGDLLELDADDAGIGKIPNISKKAREEILGAIEIDREHFGPVSTSASGS